MRVWLDPAPALAGRRAPTTGVGARPSFARPSQQPGCRTQLGCSLRDAYADLTAAGVRVVGVSTDAIAAQKAFREKIGLPFPLISDTDQRVATVFGVPTTLGYAARQTFLFKDGKLVWRELTAPTARQAADVFEALKTLGTVRLPALCSTETAVAVIAGAATAVSGVRIAFTP